MNDSVMDAALPGMNRALDVHALQELLQNALPEMRDKFDFEDFKIIDIQYKPEKSCKLLYRVKARNRQTNRLSRQLLSAILVSNTGMSPAVQQHVLSRYQPDQKTIFSTPVIPLPELNMTAYAFPVDPALPWLSEALDPVNMKQQMQRNWEWRNTNIRSVTIRPIGFTPQARAALFFEVLSEMKDTKEPEMRRLIGKIHLYKPAAILFSGAWALWRAANHKVPIAPPVGYISSLWLTLQEQVRGERLTEYAHLGSFIKPVRKTALAIAEVHKLSLPLTSIRTPEKEASVVQRWKSVLTAICPEQKKRIENLSNEISEELLRRVLVQGPVHGDFHPANVIWDDSKITLVDLDDLSYGDPFVDVGRFLASLRVSALRVSSQVSSLNNVGEAFLQQYFKHSPGDEKRARLFEASSLLIAACAPFRLQRPGWKESAVLLIDEAERVWESSRSIAVGTGTSDPVGPPFQAAPAPSGPGQAPLLQWTADGVYMRTVLDPHIRKIYGAELVACHAEIHRDQEISYKLHGWRVDDKWSITLRGTIWRKRGSAAVVKRLERLNAAMAESADRPVLPRPVVYLRPFSLIVWEAPTGLSFSRVMKHNNAVEDRAASVARALATIHRTNLEINNQNSQQDEIRALRTAVDLLKEPHPVLFSRATTLLKEVEQRIASMSWQWAPVLRRLRLQHILIHEERIGFARLIKLTKSHPFTDAADFLARLTLLGIRRNQVNEAEIAARSFRNAYQSEFGMEDDLRAFEIAALLRLVSASVALHSDGLEADHLLNFADARLQAQVTDKK